MNQISFVVRHRPQPQPRPKAARVGNMVKIYTPKSKAVRAYKEAVKEAFLLALIEQGISLDDWEPFNEPLALALKFVIKRPDNDCKDIVGKEFFHTKKPDLDNLAKGTMDALNGYAWRDDSCICSLHLTKYVSAVGLGGKSGKKKVPTEPYVRVHISPTTFQVDKSLD